MFLPASIYRRSRSHYYLNCISLFPALFFFFFPSHSPLSFDIHLLLVQWCPIICDGNCTVNLQAHTQTGLDVYEPIDKVKYVALILIRNY